MAKEENQLPRAAGKGALWISPETYESMRKAYAIAERGEPLTREAKLACQLAACHGADACAEAVRLVHEVAGTSSIRKGPLERRFRDVHTLTQHASKSAARYASVGQVLFGVPTDWFVLDL